HDNSTQGLAELRRLVNLLRDPGEETTPEATPSLDDVDALVDRAARSGPGGQLRFVHRDGRAGRPRPPVRVGLAAYRIVQESRTSAVQRGAPGEGAVDLRRDERGVVVPVTSPYAGNGRGAARAPGAGAGLTGMRERVAL